MLGHCPISLMKRRTTSYMDDDLNDDERLFLTAVRLGDLETIKIILQTKSINPNCCDYLGHRPLDIAVDNKDLELITFLIDNLDINPTHYYCAILRTVFHDSINILERLLERAQRNEELYFQLQDMMSGGSECTKCLPEVAVTNLTPIMAAAIKGNVEITRLLLEHGFFIKTPHSPKCGCFESCEKKAAEGETLTESMNRMNTYRALASPTYLLLTSSDPILSAFEMSRETEKLSRELPENQKEYKELSQKCSKLASDILNQCRNTEEVQTVLTQRRGFTDPRPHRFSRLHLAVQYEQKEFVTHPSCQQVLRSMWIETLGPWYSWPLRWRVFHVLKHALLTPIVALGFIFLPRADVLGPLRVPLHRFIYSATSYLCFLCFLLVTLLNDRRYDIKSPVTWTEVVVGSFVLGHSWEIFTNLVSKGFSNYFRSLWAVYDLIMFSMFLLTELLWFSVYAFNILSKDATHSNRMYWEWYHPILLGEGIYACALVMAFSRLLLWFQVNSRLGPLGTSVKYMAIDVLRFFMLFFIIMLAFATGLNSIYKNYRGGSSNSSSDEESSLTQPDDFVTLRATFKSLFWSMFGMGEPDFAQIVVAIKENETSTYEGDHVFTEGVGYTLWGLYHMVTVVILLNMVIAMMTESYQRVQTNADMEWKFACSTLWLTMFDSHCPVPPPFNLIPSMHRMTRFFRWLLVAIRNTSGRLSWSFSRCFYWESEVDSSARKFEEETYEKLMVQLIRRYLHCRNRQLWDVSSFSVDSDLREKLKEEILQDLYKTLKIEKSSTNDRCFPFNNSK